MIYIGIPKELPCYALNFPSVVHLYQCLKIPVTPALLYAEIGWGEAHYYKK
jgi:hypothetical protein